ncbi:MAG: SprB repeat-containing protein, partial [Sphingobacteriales bacterium]|nr:SprB repeat-containing protein [Sphingobacteriales bacterium]
KQDPSCSDSNDGVVAVMPAPDSGPLTYHWSTGDTLSSSIGGLSAGKYYVTTTNFINCSLVDSVELTTPTAVSVAATTNPSQQQCFGRYKYVGRRWYATIFLCVVKWRNYREPTRYSRRAIPSPCYRCQRLHCQYKCYRCCLARAPTQHYCLYYYHLRGSSTQLIATVAGGAPLLGRQSTGLQQS